MDRTPSILAAHLCADATAALILHDAEDHFGDQDIALILATALSLAIELQRRKVEQCDEGYLSALNKLQAAANAHVAEFG